MKITGFKQSLVAQYRYKIGQQNAQKETFPPGHNADRKKCKSCQYRSREDANNLCDYILHTGHRRGCDATDCDKYVKGERLTLKEKM